MRPLETKKTPWICIVWTFLFKSESRQFDLLGCYKTRVIDEKVIHINTFQHHRGWLQVPNDYNLLWVSGKKGSICFFFDNGEIILEKIFIISLFCQLKLLQISTKLVNFGKPVANLFQNSRPFDSLLDNGHVLVSDFCDIFRSLWWKFITREQSH